MSDLSSAMWRMDSYRRCYEPYEQAKPDQQGGDQQIPAEREYDSYGNKEFD